MSKNIINDFLVDDIRMDVSHVPLRDVVVYQKLRHELLEQLQKVSIPRIQKSHFDKAGKLIAQRDRVIGSIGRTMNLGFGRTRHGYREYVANAKYPDLFRSIVAFANQCVPTGWTYQSITLNYGVKAKLHVDGQNLGDSVIVGIGDYTGGELNVYPNFEATPEVFNIHDNPLKFNGSVYPHETQSFEGERYTLIFFCQKRAGTCEGVTMVGK